MNHHAAALFHLKKIKSWKVDSSFIETGFTESYVCLTCRHGEGEIFLDQKRYKLQPGDCIFILPGRLVELRASGGDSLELVGLEFELLEEAAHTVEPNRMFRSMEEWQPEFVALSKQNARIVSKLILQLKDLADEALNYWRYDILLVFHKIIYQLHTGEQNIQSNQTDKAIEHTMLEMKEELSRGWTRDELAQMAGMSPWYYSHMFKRQAGVSPIRYLTNLRMQRARELLIGGMKLREACEEVGYSDESQFRRAFKAATGQLPSVFMRSQFERVATLSYSYTAHLLALDIMPIAAPVDCTREPHRTSYHPHIKHSLIRKRNPSMPMWKENVKILKEAKPQLIITDDLVPGEIMQELHQLAPTISIPWMEGTWKEQLRYIASILRLESRAKNWLKAYHKRADDTSKAVRLRIGEDRISILHLSLGNMVVYGNRNGGAVLYEDLKLDASYVTTDIAVCKAITLNTLTQFTGDRILLIIDQDEASLTLWSQLQQQAEWKGLKAVQNNLVYLLNEVPWLEYSPLAHRLILDEFLTLLD